MLLQLKKRIIAVGYQASLKKESDIEDFFQQLNLDEYPSSPESGPRVTIESLSSDQDDNDRPARRLFSGHIEQRYPGDLITPTFGHIDPFQNTKLVRHQQIALELDKRRKKGEDTRNLVKMAGVTGAIQYKNESSSSGQNRWSPVVGGGCFLGENIFVTDHHCVKNHTEFKITFTDYSHWPSDSFTYKATRVLKNEFHDLAASLKILFNPNSDINLLILTNKKEDQFPAYNASVTLLGNEPLSLTHLGFKGGVMHVSISSERMVLATELVKRSWSLEGLAVSWSQMKTRGVVRAEEILKTPQKSGEPVSLRKLSVDSTGQKNQTMEVTPDRAIKLYKTSQRTSEIDLKVRLPMIFWPDCTVVAHKTGPGSSGGTYWDESIGFRGGFHGLHLGKLPHWMFPTDVEHHFENHLVARIGVNPLSVFKLLPYLKFETIPGQKETWENSFSGLSKHGDLPGYEYSEYGEDGKFGVYIQKKVNDTATQDLFNFLFEKLKNLSETGISTFKGDQTVSREIINNSNFEFQELAVTAARFYKNEIKNIHDFIDKKGAKNLDKKIALHDKKKWKLSLSEESNSEGRMEFSIASGDKTKTLTITPKSWEIFIDNQIINPGALGINIVKKRYVMVVSANTSPKGKLVENGRRADQTRHAEALSLAQLYQIKEERWGIDPVIVTHGKINTECEACTKHIGQFDEWRHDWNNNL